MSVIIWISQLGANGPQLAQDLQQAQKSVHGLTVRLPSSAFICIGPGSFLEALHNSRVRELIKFSVRSMPIHDGRYMRAVNFLHSTLGADLRTCPLTCLTCQQAKHGTF